MMNNQLNVIPSNVVALHLDSSLHDFSLFSGLNNLAGKKVFFRTDFSKETIPLQNLESTSDWTPYKVLEFSAHPRERSVIAVDSSCVLIGETAEGSIYAGKVAMVTSRKSGISCYHRAGPMIFYLSPKSFEEDYRNLVPKRVLRAVLSDRNLAERFIRIQLERNAQIQASRSSSDTIILIDGALRSSILEPRNLSYNTLERSADENFNQLVAISKSTSIRLISKAASALHTLKKGQIFSDLTDSLSVFTPNHKGKILVAKFTPNAQVFRVDISRANAEEESQVLADLRFNDIFFRGYPESLRLAHHLSVFDSSTIASVRSYLSKKFSLVQIPSDDLRETILGKLV